jgi:hypothetical protein
MAIDKAPPARKPRPPRHMGHGKYGPFWQPQRTRPPRGKQATEAKATEAKFTESKCIVTAINSRYPQAVFDALYAAGTRATTTNTKDQ